TITENKKVLLDYFAAKARLLGSERLAWYDQSAPLPKIPGTGVEAKVAYRQACDWIIESFRGFSHELGDFADHALRQGWIEAENRSGKRQGGFCTGFFGAKESRIFMTYTDSAD